MTCSPSGGLTERRASTTMKLNVIKDRQQKTWTSGDYERIGNTLVIMGELLCEAVDVHAGDKVLDVATGSGNTAISAACRFCDVTGIDYVPELIEHARKRADVEGLEITFNVGDAEDLPYPDASFDVVLSTLGVMLPRIRRRPPKNCCGSAGPEGRSGWPTGLRTASSAICSAPWASTYLRPPE